MRSVVGIDASFSGFGVAHAGRGRTRVEEWKAGSLPKGSPAAARMARIEWLIAKVSAFINRITEQGGERPLIVLEHYSYGSPGNSTLDLAELGGVLRYHLIHILGCEVIEVAPGTLKRFETGKGNAGKPAVVSVMTRRYDRHFETDNQADAFAAAQLGMVLLGQADPKTAYERDVALQVAKARKAAA